MESQSPRSSKCELDSLICAAPRFVRKLSDKPLDGYYPSFRFDDMYEEGDALLRDRITAAWPVDGPQRDDL